MAGVLYELDKHPAERDLIGRIILLYGVLEVGLLQLVSAVLGGKIYTAQRILYRLRSESNRLEVADALIRSTLAEHHLSQAWEDAYSAMKFCKGIRNTYAHSQWLSDNGFLRFGDMDKTAKTRDGKSQIDFHPLIAATLEKQLAYFTHTYHLLLWSLDQYQIAAGLPRKLPDGQHVLKPKKTPRPKPDSRGEAHSRRAS